MQGPAALFSPLVLLFFVAWGLRQVAATSTNNPSFFEQSFFFDYDPPGTTIPIPVTQQCATLQLTWERGTATGPNPTAPYYLQIFLSTFVVPIIIPAGSGTSFNFTVPWNPGTLYQICMWDSMGQSGGCQGLYTVIPSSSPSANASTPISCQNVTYPTSAMNVDAAVVSGAFSQYGWVPQCTDIEVLPKNGTPPYTFTIAPTLHPPLNITSTTASPMNWTVSLSHGIPFFIAVEDSQGNVWAQGPLHSGDNKDTSCLNINHTGVSSGSSSHLGEVIGAAAGGIFVGLLVGGLGMLLFRRCRSRRASEHPHPRKDSPELGMGTPREVTGITSGGNLGPGGLEYIVEPFSIPGSSPSDPSVPLLPGGSASPPSSPPDALSASGSSDPSSRGRSNVYVVHHDGGRAPVTVYTSEGQEVVELPPRYADGGSSSDGRSAIERGREPGPQPRKRGPRST